MFPMEHHPRNHIYSCSQNFRSTIWHSHYHIYHVSPRFIFLQKIFRKMGAAALGAPVRCKRTCVKKKNSQRVAPRSSNHPWKCGNFSRCPDSDIYNAEVVWGGSKDGKLDILVNNAFQDPAQKDPKSDSLLSKAGFCWERHSSALTMCVRAFKGLF